MIYITAVQVHVSTLYLYPIISFAAKSLIFPNNNYYYLREKQYFIWNIVQVVYCSRNDVGNWIRTCKTKFGIGFPTLQK